MGEDIRIQMAPAPKSPSFRPTYTREQLEAYVSTCVAPHPSYTLADLEREIEQDPLKALGTLQVRQLAFNPWGNIGMHYSQHRTITLDTEVIYHKIVERKLGGYCMENNTFFSTILRSLGYKLYTTGARICNALSIPPSPNTFTGWSHQVIITTIKGKKYLVDVGFGSTTPLHPIPLDPSSDTVYGSVPGAELRLVHRNIDPNTDEGQRLFILESRVKDKPEWQGCYCFDTLEWLPADFVPISYQVSQSRNSFFTYRLMLLKILLDEETKSKASGTLILMGGKFERRMGANPKEVLLEAKDERERVQGLEKWFGVKLRDEEKRGIQGTVTELIERDLSP
jgi:arylamine N-acetyltransferase